MHSEHLPNNTGADEGFKSIPKRPWVEPIALGWPNLALYLLLLIPIILFLASLYFPPRINLDAQVGFLALRNMLEGGDFNSIPLPDPTNIANDVVTFLTLWTPGQYLVPGGFVWLGTNYGLAVSLTALIATLIGVLGWIQVARSFGVRSFVLFVFVLGLNTFSYVTNTFRVYNGGEVLLFAAAPWSLWAMRWAANKTPSRCFAVSLLSAALLFLAKDNGLIVFATNVVAISLSALVSQRRLDFSILGMWVASLIAALCFMMFWVARGPVVANGSTFIFNWFAIWFSVAGVAFSGISGLDFLAWFLDHTSIPIIFDFTRIINYVIGPLGLLLMMWVWFRLRHTRYHDMVVLLLTIIFFYALAVAVMWLRGAPISFDERHFRYAGILFFLLFLAAIDQWQVPIAKGLAWVMIIVLGFYGLRHYATGAYAQTRAGYYDPMTGINQDFSPTVLDYMRSGITRHNVERAIAVVPSLSAAVALSRFRILDINGEQLSLEMIAAQKWAGRAEKIFVVVQEEMLLNGKAEAILRSFTDYEFDNWRQIKLDGMIIYTQ
jgi:hypothetical protein